MDEKWRLKTVRKQTIKAKWRLRAAKKKKWSAGTKWRMRAKKSIASFKWRLKAVRKRSIAATWETGSNTIECCCRLENENEGSEKNGRILQSGD